MYCTKCGTQNDDEARFCTKCGAPSPPPHQSQTTQQPQQHIAPVPQKKWYDNMLIVILLLLFCFPAGIVALVMNRKTSQKTKLIIAGVWMLLMLIGFALPNFKEAQRRTQERESANQQEEKSDMQARSTGQITYKQIAAIYKDISIEEGQPHEGRKQFKGKSDDVAVLLVGEKTKLYSATSLTVLDCPDNANRQMLRFLLVSLILKPATPSWADDKRTDYVLAKMGELEKSGEGMTTEILNNMEVSVLFDHSNTRAFSVCLKPCQPLSTNEPVRPAASLSKALEQNIKPIVTNMSELNCRIEPLCRVLWDRDLCPHLMSAVSVILPSNCWINSFELVPFYEELELVKARAEMADSNLSPIVVSDKELNAQPVMARLRGGCYGNWAEMQPVVESAIGKIPGVLKCTQTEMRSHRRYADFDLLVQLDWDANGVADFSDVTNMAIAGCANVDTFHASSFVVTNGTNDRAVIEQYQERLQEMKGEEMALCMFMAGQPMYNPSEFKEKVRKTGDDMFPAFKEKNIPVPDDFGFGSFYTGRDLPREHEMPKLISQYLIIKDVASVLLEHTVIKVELIDRNPYVPVDVRGQDGEPQASVLESVPVMFKFTTTPDNLYGMLAGIRNKDNLYRIRSLKTTTEPVAIEERNDPSSICEEMNVEMIVEHIVLHSAPPSVDKSDSPDKLAICTDSSTNVPKSKVAATLMRARTKVPPKLPRNCMGHSFLQYCPQCKGLHPVHIVECPECGATVNYGIGDSANAGN